MYSNAPCTRILAKKIDGLRRALNIGERPRWRQIGGEEDVWTCPACPADDPFSYMEHFSGSALITRAGRHAIIHEYRRVSSVTDGGTFLMFGSGKDSAMFCSAVAASGGVAHFLEADTSWMGRLEDVLAKTSRNCFAHYVPFTSRKIDWMGAIERRDRAELMPELTAALVGLHADVVVVDGPVGSIDASPGRVLIFAASQLAAPEAAFS